MKDKASRPLKVSGKPQNRTYHFEVYTCNPQTGEAGWDIECGIVHHVQNRAWAISKVKRHYCQIVHVAIQVYEVSNDIKPWDDCIILDARV